MDKKKIICDSDVIIDYLDSKQERYLSTSKHIENIIGLKNILISSISIMEILAGARNKQELYKIQKLLNNFNEFKINHEITDIAVNLISDYTLSHGLAMPDALIAATAMYIRCPLFTYNIKDYKFITNLNLYPI